MGWDWQRYPTDIRARLDEHGGPKEERDAELWKAFVADVDVAVQKVIQDPKYADLDLYVDWEEADR